MRLIGYVLWCTDQQNKVIKWTTAWEHWMNQQTFSLQLLFKTRPCKTSWQTEFTCFIWGGQMLWLLWAAYENILCVQYMSSLLWNNSVVILNTYCCDHASAWTDLNPEKTCLSGQRKTFCKGLILLDDSVLLPFTCLCCPWAIHYVCLPGLCAVRHSIENAF